MKGQKFFRLFLGLIFLFSIFLFQGSEDHHECAQCGEEQGTGTLTLVNKTHNDLNISIIPAMFQGLLRPEHLTESETKVTLNQGVHQIIVRDYSKDLVIVEIRVVKIMPGKNVTITIR